MVVPPSSVTVTPSPVSLTLSNLVPSLKAMPAPAERALEQLGARLLLGRHQVRQRLDDGDLGAERAPHAGELDADHAAAEHDDRGGHVVELQRVVAGDDPLAVDAPGRAGCASPSRSRARRASPLITRSPTCTAVGEIEPAVALDDLDLAALDQAGQALVEPGDDPVLVGVDAGHVDAVEGRCARRTLGPSLASSATSAACSSALVGMQPRCRQVPPTLSSSMSATRMPSSAARSAQA